MLFDEHCRGAVEFFGTSVEALERTTLGIDDVPRRFAQVAPQWNNAQLCLRAQGKNNVGVRGFHDDDVVCPVDQLDTQGACSVRTQVKAVLTHGEDHVGSSSQSIYAVGACGSDVAAYEAIRKVMFCPHRC